MSKKYEDKKPTGKEYVDAARELCGYTINRCLQLPAEWGRYLLDPLVDDANEIERLVFIANRVYINSKNQPEEDLIKAYQTRDNYLTEALRYLDDFDIKFDRLMSYVDVSGHEMTRMKNEILKLIMQDPDVGSELKEVKIKMVLHRDCMEYRGVNGAAYESLKLNSKNKDHWLFLRLEAEEWIRKRISWDKTAVKRLSNNES